MGESERKEGLTSTTASNTENGVDGDDLDTEPGLEESGCLLGSVGSSGAHSVGDEDKGVGECECGCEWRGLG